MNIIIAGMTPDRRRMPQITNSMSATAPANPSYVSYPGLNPVSVCTIAIINSSRVAASRPRKTTVPMRIAFWLFPVFTA